MNIQLFTQIWRTHWKSLASWGAVLVFLNSLELYIYPSISKSSAAMTDFVNSFPDAFKKMFRMTDYFSGPGFLGTELFSLIIPMVMIGVGLAWGAAATAEDEEEGSADLIFTLPIRRITILWSRFFASVTALAFLSLLNFLNLLIGSRIVNLEVETSHLAAATLTCFLMGLMFTALGTLLGALIGKRGLGLGVGSGIAILLYVFYTVSNLVTKFDFVKPINPFQWALSADELLKGFALAPNLKLLLGTVIFISFSSIIIERRDIHSI